MTKASLDSPREHSVLGSRPSSAVRPEGTRFSVLRFCGSPRGHPVLWFCGSAVLGSRFSGSVVQRFCGSAVLWFAQRASGSAVLGSHKGAHMEDLLRLSAERAIRYLATLDERG